MKLLDLFCAAGGASVGYARAGFEVTGVDICPQPNYPYTFVQGDALAYLCDHWHEYDVITASPPCQAHSQLGVLHKHSDYYERHTDMIAVTRVLLRMTGKPYVIENVERAKAHMRNPITVCGAPLGLKVYRHRLFESNLPLRQPAHDAHDDDTPSAGRGVSSKGFITVSGSGGIQGLGMPYMEYASMAMGIDWMTRIEISQAIPPAYTEYIGAQLRSILDKRRCKYCNGIKLIYAGANEYIGDMYCDEWACIDCGQLTTGECMSFARR